MDYYDEWDERGPVGERVRIHLSIPRELRRRMRATPGISWSQVAARAFRRALALAAELEGDDGVKEDRAARPGRAS